MRLDLEEYQEVGVVSYGDGGKQAVKVEVRVTGIGDSCADCSQAEYTTDVGCTLDLSVGKSTVLIGKSSTLTVKYKACGTTSPGESCTMNVTASGTKKNGNKYQKDEYHIEKSPLTFSGGGGEKTVKITGYRPGALEVKVGGGSCECGPKSRQINVKERDTDDPDSISDIKITRDTGDTGTNRQGIEYLCSAKPGEYTVNRYCWGGSQTTFANVDVFVKGGRDEDEFIVSPREYSLACGGEVQDELNVSEELTQKDEEKREKFPQLKATSNCCGTDTTDEYDPDMCRVQVNRDHIYFCDEQDKKTIKAEVVCGKARDCSETVIEWDIPGGLKKVKGGNGDQSITLKNKGNKPINNAMIRAKPVKEGDQDLDCPDCKEGSVPVGVQRTGTIDVTGLMEKEWYGTDAVDRQGGSFFNEIEFNPEKLVDGGTVKRVRLTRLSVQLQEQGGTFPWLESGTLSTIKNVEYDGVNKTVDKRLDDAGGVKSVTLKPGYELYDRNDPDQPVESYIRVDVRSARQKLEVIVKPTFEVTFSSQKCEVDGSFTIGPDGPDKTSTSKTAIYEGLEITKLPQYIFGDADYWMPIRVKLPETLRGRHFPEAAEDEPNEIGVERIDVQLMHRKSQTAEPDDEIGATFAKKSGTDENNDDIDEDEVGDSDPTNTVRWGLGDGTTSGGTFTPTGDDFTIQGQGRQEKKRELTVFVNLKKLMKKKLGGAIAETENGKIHLFNGNNGGPIPRFQVVLQLSAEDGASESFASLVADDGRPKLLADHRIGPVLEPGQPTEENNVRFPVHYKDSTGPEYIGFLDYEMAGIKHLNTNEFSSICSNNWELETEQRSEPDNTFSNRETFSEEVNLDSFPDEVPVTSYIPNSGCVTNLENYPLREYGRARAKSTSVARLNPQKLLVRTFTNMYDVTLNNGDGERAAAKAHATTGTFFYVSYGKLDLQNIHVMNLSHKSKDINVEIKEMYPFQNTALYAGIDEQRSDDPTLDITFTVVSTVAGLIPGTPFVVGAALTVGGASKFVYDIMQDDPSAGTIARVEFNDFVIDSQNLGSPDTIQFKKDSKFEQHGGTWGATTQGDSSGVDMQIRQITWDMDSEEEAFTTGTRNITNQGETFSGLREQYVNNVDVGAMINFHMEFTLNSEMESFTTTNMQTIGEILYFKKNTKPIIQNVKLSPLSD